MGRHRVEQFVADQAAGKMLGQFVQPFDAVGKLRRPCGQRRLLARAQFAGEFEDAVALGQAVECRQGRQQVRREPAAAGAGFDHLRARGGDDLRHLPRQRSGEQRCQLRRGEEVAPGLMVAELVRPPE
jgi:hypothetical protein